MNTLVHIIAIAGLIVALLWVASWGDGQDDDDLDGDPA